MKNETISLYLARIAALSLYTKYNHKTNKSKSSELVHIHFRVDLNLSLTREDDLSALHLDHEWIVSTILCEEHSGKYLEDLHTSNSNVNLQRAVESHINNDKVINYDSLSILGSPEYFASYVQRANDLLRDAILKTEENNSILFKVLSNYINKITVPWDRVIWKQGKLKRKQFRL
jgi:hypothetical protein